MEIFEKPCTLYTLNGELSAKATEASDGKTYIQSDDASVNLIVNTPTARRKYEQETCPTFYNC